MTRLRPYLEHGILEIDNSEPLSAIGPRTRASAEVRTGEGKPYPFVAIDRTSKFAVPRLYDEATRPAACQFLEELLEVLPYPIQTLLTDDVLCREEMAAWGVRSRGIRATGCCEDGCPGGLRRQEVVSSIANTGSA
jgi:hypothetical protein